MNKLICSFFITLVISSPVYANQYLEQLQNLQSSPSKINSQNPSPSQLGNTKADINSVYTLKKALIDFQYDELKIVCDNDYNHYIIEQSCNSDWKKFYKLENSVNYDMSQNEFITQAEDFIKLRDNFRAKCRTNRWCK